MPIKTILKQTHIFQMQSIALLLRAICWLFHKSTLCEHVLKTAFSVQCCFINQLFTLFICKHHNRINTQRY